MSTAAASTEEVTFTPEDHHRYATIKDELHRKLPLLPEAQDVWDCGGLMAEVRDRRLFRIDGDEGLELWADRCFAVKRHQANKYLQVHSRLTREECAHHRGGVEALYQVALARPPWRPLLWTLLARGYGAGPLAAGRRAAEARVALAAQDDATVPLQKLLETIEDAALTRLIKDDQEKVEARTSNRDPMVHVARDQARESKRLMKMVDQALPVTAESKEQLRKTALANLELIDALVVPPAVAAEPDAAPAPPPAARTAPPAEAVVVPPAGTLATSQAQPILGEAAQRAAALPAEVRQEVEQVREFWPLFDWFLAQQRQNLLPEPTSAAVVIRPRGTPDQEAQRLLELELGTRWHWKSCTAIWWQPRGLDVPTPLFERWLSTLRALPADERFVFALRGMLLYERDRAMDIIVLTEEEPRKQDFPEARFPRFAVLVNLLAYHCTDDDFDRYLNKQDVTVESEWDEWDEWDEMTASDSDDDDDDDDRDDDDAAFAAAQ